MTAWWIAAKAAGSEARITIAPASRARVSVRSRAAAGTTLSRLVAVPPTATSWRIAVSGAPIRCSRAAARSAVISSTVGGSCATLAAVSRADPIRTPVATASRRGPATMNSLLPPPTSTTARSAAGSRPSGDADQREIALLLVGEHVERHAAGTLDVAEREARVVGPAQGLGGDECGRGRAQVLGDAGEAAQGGGELGALVAPEPAALVDDAPEAEERRFIEQRLEAVARRRPRRTGGRSWSRHRPRRRSPGRCHAGGAGRARRALALGRARAISRLPGWSRWRPVGVTSERARPNPTSGPSSGASWRPPPSSAQAFAAAGLAAAGLAAAGLAADFAGAAFAAVLAGAAFAADAAAARVAGRAVGRRMGPVFRAAAGFAAVAAFGAAVPSPEADVPEARPARCASSSRPSPRPCSPGAAVAPGPRARP